MMARDLTVRELEQRREAGALRVTHGAYRGRINRFAWGPGYESMREAFCRAVGRRTTLRERELLQELAARFWQLDQAQAWLEAQPDPLFRDRAAGELHPIVARMDEWTMTISRLRERLWEIAGTSASIDLATAMRRTGGRR